MINDFPTPLYVGHSRPRHLDVFDSHRVAIEKVRSIRCRQQANSLFPVKASLKAGVKGTYRETACSSTPPSKKKDEFGKRYISVAEEARIKEVLNAGGKTWNMQYCLNESKSGERVGYTVSIIGFLEGPEAVQPLIERMFRDAYLLPAVSRTDPTSHQRSPYIRRQSGNPWLWKLLA